MEVGRIDPLRVYVSPLFRDSPLRCKEAHIATGRKVNGILNSPTQLPGKFLSRPLEFV